MINVTYMDIYYSRNGFEKIKKHNFTIKNQLIISDFFDEYDKYLSKITKSYNDLVIKYGKKDDKGGCFISYEDKEALEKFNNEFEEVLNVNVELNIKPINVDIIENVELSRDDFKDIKPFIDFQQPQINKEKEEK